MMVYYWLDNPFLFYIKGEVNYNSDIPENWLVTWYNFFVLLYHLINEHFLFAFNYLYLTV